MVARLICALLTVALYTNICLAGDVIVDTPNICIKTDKVDGNNVYLKTTSAKCPKGIGKAEIRLEEDSPTVNVYVDGILWKKQAVGTTGSDLAQQALKRADKMADGMKLPENSNKAAGSSRAKEVSDYVKSDVYQAKLAAETQRIKSALFPGDNSVLTAYYPDLPDQKDKTKSGRLSSKERIYVFISSSVPVETLRNYAISIDHLNDPNVVMVMRGMVNSMSRMSDTSRFILQIVNKDTFCDPLKTKCATYIAPVDIDPLLFRRYKIDQVPAIVYVKDVNLIDDGSEGLEQNTSVGENFTVYGDISLEYALELFSREPGNKSLEKVLAQFSNN